MPHQTGTVTTWTHESWKRSWVPLGPRSMNFNLKTMPWTKNMTWKKQWHAEKKNITQSNHLIMFTCDIRFVSDVFCKIAAWLHGERHFHHLYPVAFLQVAGAAKCSCFWPATRNISCGRLEALNDSPNFQMLFVFCCSPFVIISSIELHSYG